MKRIDMIEGLFELRDEFLKYDSIECKQEDVNLFDNIIKELDKAEKKEDDRIFYRREHHVGELTLKEAEDKLMELIQNLCKFEVSSITSIDIAAMEKILKAKTFHGPIKLRVSNAMSLKSALKKLEEDGIIENGDYANLDITIG
ncbi:hypothetical protein CJD_1343 [Clostridium perfringens D str. JGS1721]|uniref:Uncharacterized protein n=1 Tax=Clostridium perfringens D str. JGS1721 TaxID=488537 RepID=B1V2L2_CLOPF|nr:hypothetical protein [Clostridium perfringens]EDT71877.1 hypothetical protein CJD_1343 [Clostridium perfringens D str. JGS1721]